MLKVIFITAALLFSQFCLAESETVDGRPVLVGFDGAYSVKGSTSADAIELGIKAAMYEINANGGVLDGRPLKLLKMDNHSVPARGIANLQKMVQIRDLVAVFGGRFSPVVLQQIDFVHEYGLPLIDVWAAANGVTDHEYSPSYTFRVSLKDNWAMPLMLERMSNLKKTNIGVMLPLTGWGRSNEKALRKSLVSYPELQVSQIVWYSFGEREMLDKYRELLTKGAEAIVFVGNDNEGSRLLQQLAINPGIVRLPIVSHWGVTGGTMVDSSGPVLHEMDFTVVQTFSFFDLEKDRLDDFMKSLGSVSDIEKPEDILSPVGTAHAYDAVHILAKAIERAGTTDRAAVRDSLEAHIFHDGLVKRYAPAFTENNHDALSPDDLFLARFREDGVIVSLQ